MKFYRVATIKNRYKIIEIEGGFLAPGYPEFQDKTNNEILNFDKNRIFYTHDGAADWIKKTRGSRGFI
jgi:hypothetical protein